MRARPLGGIVVALAVVLVAAGCAAKAPRPGANPPGTPNPTSSPVPVPGAGTPAPASWGYGTLDGAAGAVSTQTLDAGQFVTGVRLGTTNHLFYRDTTHGYLRHAWEDTAVSSPHWQFENLDGNGGSNGRISADVGTDVKATVVGADIELFYYDVTNGDLRHATLAGSTWSFETLDGSTVSPTTGSIAADVGSDISVATTSTGPRVFYYDVTDGDLRTAARTGSAWTLSTIDGNTAAPNGTVADDVGQYTSSVVAPGGVVHVFAYDDTATVLRHGWLDNTGWHFETLDGDSVTGGRVDESVGSDTTSLVAGGSVQVFYYDIDAGALRHAWLDGTGWHFETIDGSATGVAAGRTTADVGQYASAISAGGTVQVFYYDLTDGDLRHATVAGAGWTAETLDGDSTNAGRTTDNVGVDSLSVILDSSLHVFYYDVAAKDLREAIKN